MVESECRDGGSVVVELGCFQGLSHDAEIVLVAGQHPVKRERDRAADEWVGGVEHGGEGYARVSRARGDALATLWG